MTAGGTAGTSGSDTSNSLPRELCRETVDACASEPFRDVEGLLAREPFRVVAALYASGETGLSSSNVPIDLRQRSSGRT